MVQPTYAGCPRIGCLLILYIGKEIVEEEQRGKARAAYGKKLLEMLSQRLSDEFGKGFDVSNLWNMRQFYQTYPILDAVRRELSWTHYRILMRIEKPEGRSFYEIECVNNNWSSRELERQKGSFLFERLALSKDKKGLMKLAHKGQELQKYVNYYDRELKTPNDNPTVGLILCEHKKEAVVRYTLAKDNKQIFASRYKLYLPTEKELVRELKRERLLRRRFAASQ